MSGQGVLRIIEGGQLGFWCPGCKSMHAVDVNPGGWTFNGDYDKPTFTPSVLVRGGHHAPGWNGPECWCTFYPKHHPDAARKFVCSICHSFVTAGHIQFLADSSHALAGQTVALEVPQC
jgi:hypothetical protein